MNKYLSLILSFVFFTDRYNAIENERLSLQSKIRICDSLIKIDKQKSRLILDSINNLLGDGTLSSDLRFEILLVNSKWHIESKSCDSAMLYAMKTREIATTIRDKLYSSSVYAKSNWCFGRTDSALKYYYTVEHYATQISDTNELTRCYYNIGLLLSELGEFKKAEKYFIHCNKLSSLTKNEIFSAYSNFALGSNFADQGINEKAIPLLNKALIYFNNISHYSQVATIYNNLAHIFKQKGEYEKSYVYFEKSLHINKDENNSSEVVHQLNNLAFIRMTQNRYAEALPLLLQAEKIASGLKDQPTLPEIYHNLSLCYEQTKDYEKAFLYKDTELELIDSLRSLEMLKNTERLQEEFEAEKRTLEISNLKQENEVKELRSVAHLKQRNWFMALAAGLFIMALLVFFFFRQRVLNARRLNQKNTLIHQQQMQEVIRKSELQSIHTMLETQETERKRIAQDLHDRLGSMLSTVKLQFGHFSPKANEDKERYSKVSHLLDDAVEEIRQVSHNLVSGVLSTFGLVPALKDLIQALKESSALVIEMQVHGMNERMDSELEINLYRILQELFNNTIRHAKAGRVDIELSRHPNELTLIYSDNGTGFDTQNLKQSGMGLKNLYSRVDKLGGSLHIDSGKGNGSTFVFNFPLS